MDKIRFTLLILIALAVSTKALAYDFEKDNLAYSVLSYADRTLILEGVADYTAANDAEYVIPEELEYAGVMWTVRKVAESAFNNYNNFIKSISLPSTITEIGKQAFYNCQKLEHLILPSNIEEIPDQMCFGCTKLQEISLPSTLKVIGFSAFQRCNSLTEVVVPESVTEIGAIAFAGCESLIKLTLPDNFVEFPSNLVNGCVSLKTINIPSRIKIIGARAFENCKNLTHIVIPDSVLSIEHRAFYGCENTEIILNDSIEFIGEDAFYGNTKFVNLVIPEKVSNIQGFTYNTNLETVAIPQNATTITSLRGCDKLSYVYIPDSIQHIKQNSFMGSKGLQEIEFSPNGHCTDIESGAFYGSGIKRIKFADHVTEKYYEYDTIWYKSMGVWQCYYKLKSGPFYRPGRVHVAKGAFAYCTDLEEIEISRPIGRLDEECFAHCENVTKVWNYKKRPLEIKENVFATKAYIQGTLYVPIGTSEAYRNAVGWQNFTNIVEFDAGEDTEDEDYEYENHFPDPNAIMNVSANQSHQTKIFTLSGVMVGNDFSTLPSGLYIVDGKKIMKR